MDRQAIGLDANGESPVSATANTTDTPVTRARRRFLEVDRLDGVRTRACGWSLARAHARSGDRLAIAAYLGAGPKFDRPIASFSTLYADQNELDHQRLADAVAAGEVAAEPGI